MKMDLNSSQGKYFSVTLVAESKQENKRILDIAMAVNEQSTLSSADVASTNVVGKRSRKRNKRVFSTPCPVCGKIYVGNSGLATHLSRNGACKIAYNKMKEGGEIDLKKPHKCKICGKGFAKITGLFIHMGHKHTREEKRKAYAVRKEEETNTQEIKTNFLELETEKMQVIK